MLIKARHIFSSIILIMLGTYFFCCVFQNQNYNDMGHIIIEEKKYKKYVIKNKISNKEFLNKRVINIFEKNVGLIILLIIIGFYIAVRPHNYNSYNSQLYKFID